MSDTDLLFAARIPPLVLRDPLAEALGALRPGGVFRYTYEDAVRLAGHSCPTVARAWLATAAALPALWPDGTPERGAIEVVIGGQRDDGASGPMALVIGMITGAAPETGFGGLMGRWKRRDLLRFDAALAGLRFRRTDTGAAVTIRFVAGAAPAPPDLGAAMAAALRPQASADDRARFAALWQGRVESMLLGDPNRLLHVEHDVPAA